MAVPFPPRAFPAPELHPADRGSAVALENGTINRGFAIALENGTIVNGYLRRNDPQHEFAYERYQKVIDLGQKGKILYGRIYMSDPTRRDFTVEPSRLLLSRNFQNPGCGVNRAPRIPWWKLPSRK